MARQVSWMWGGKRHYGTFIKKLKHTYLLEQKIIK